jgi:hypothetical protein
VWIVQRKTGDKVDKRINRNAVEIKNSYQKRPIRFLEVMTVDGWQVKMYSISVKKTLVDASWIESARQQLPEWLNKSGNHTLPTYKIATLIIHEGKEGCFAIINWWVDENMLQLYVYLADYNTLINFRLFSDNGIVTCVWEMAVLWFERNAWVDSVLKHPGDPNAVKNYLARQMNEDV